jgi:hypothetical protein
MFNVVGLMCVNELTCSLGSSIHKFFCGAECDKDTKEDDLKEATFKPKLCTFEEDIMNAMGIKETRKRAKTYWY